MFYVEGLGHDLSRWRKKVSDFKFELLSTRGHPRSCVGVTPRVTVLKFCSMIALLAYRLDNLSHFDIEY